MNKRSFYLAGVWVVATALMAQYVFSIDFGSFVWGLALMVLVFAAAYFVTPADSDTPAD
jgi:hypothetical protein